MELTGPSLPRDRLVRIFLHPLIISVSSDFIICSFPSAIYTIIHSPLFYSLWLNNKVLVVLKKSLVSPPVCFLASQMGRHPYLYDSHASESGWDDWDEKTHQAMQRGRQSKTLTSCDGGWVGLICPTGIIQHVRRARLPHTSSLISGIMGAPGWLLMESNSNYKNRLVLCVLGLPGLHSLIEELQCSPRFIISLLAYYWSNFVSTGWCHVYAAHSLCYIIFRTLPFRLSLLIK